MISIDFNNKTFTCPYCGKEQTYSNNNAEHQSACYRKGFVNHVALFSVYGDIEVLHIKCTNGTCNKITVVAHDKNRQWDIIPEDVHKHYPEYIPLQIRNDYEEASSIIDRSPKAAATLLRRCLQGMIRDFWGIHKSRLYDEIDAIKDKVSASQWKALNGLRSIGNIGAHMEKDVDLIIDIEPEEALKLQKMIELLLDKWYIARHEEEKLYADIVQTADEKQEQRKTQ